MEELAAIACLLLIAGNIQSMADVRSYDGSANNLANPEWGSVGVQLQRLSPPLYGDSMASLAVEARPSPRAVSNAMCEQATIMASSHGLSDMIWVWGQFLDHDITLSPEGHSEFAPIMTEEDDMLGPMIPMMRSTFDPSTGTDADNPRQQTNEITAFIDASNVYGSSQDKALRLRTGERGMMLIADDGMLPKGIEGVDMANPVGLASEELHSAGDVRANENPALLAMHTLWAREHNFHASRLAEENPEWSDEQLFQHARRIVAGEMQAITYQEYLPALIGDAAPSLDEAKYDPTLNPGIINEFSAAIYRLGHSMIPTHIGMVTEQGTMSEQPLILLRECFFNPQCLAENVSVEAVLRGVVAKPMQEIDAHVVDDLRNFLFGQPGSGGLDLISLNIQRGRDHGIPAYNSVRESLGLQKVESFDQIVTKPKKVEDLTNLYGTPDALDLWVGAILEPHTHGSVGETIAAGMREQFVRLRDGDRFFFLFDAELSDDEKAAIRGTTLAQVIRRNTTIAMIPDDVFHAHSTMIVDSDGDGISDLSEAIAGTDATDALSNLRVLSFATTQEKGTLTWSSVPGKMYTVEFQSDLGGSWMALGSMDASAEGEVTTFEDTAADRLQDAAGYYRVSIRK